MFQEEVTKLERQLVDARDRADQAETAHQRLSILLSDEKQKTTDLEREVHSQGQELANTKQKLSAAAQAVEKLANMERSMNEWQDMANAEGKARAEFETQIARTTVELTETKDLLTAAKSELARVRSQVEPVQNLVDALKIKAGVDARITEELKVLGLQLPQ